MNSTYTRPTRQRSLVATIALFVLAACGTGNEGVGPTTETPASEVARPAGNHQPTQHAITKTGDITYTPDRLLDVHAPVAAGGWPVAVVVHGLGQHRGDFTPLAEAIAAEGMVAFNISTAYSVPPLDGIQDIACAIRFARARAEQYGGDAGSLTLVGNSSGAAKGAIVAMAGDAYRGDCVVPDGSSLPDAIVGYEGPFDYATHLYGSFNVPQLQNDDRETWESVDPFSQIGGNGDLVVRLIHGDDEDIAWYDVLPEVSVAFHEALTLAGYDASLTILDGATHGSLRPGTEAFLTTVRQVVEVAGR